MIQLGSFRVVFHSFLLLGSAGVCTSTASFNNLNQFASRTVPGYVQSLGSAHSNATVTVNLTPTERKGEYFRGEVAFDNTAAPVWASLTNTAVLSNVLSSEVLQQFIAQTPETFAYDAEGNLTNDGRWTYVWGADNRLLSMETDTDVPTAAKRKLAFDYDPLGRRIQSEVQVWNPSTLNYELSTGTKFLYDGWNLVAELNATNDTPLRTYAWAGGFDSLLWVNDRTGGQTNSHFVAYDGNGNLVALANASGVNAQYEYGPFGEVIRATGSLAKTNPFRFSTKYQDDETDLLYYGYRYYSPVLGRWPNRDPIGERGGKNLYGFVGNDPLRRVDVLGLSINEITATLTLVDLRYESEGRAFRDPHLPWDSWGKFSIFTSSESGVQQSTEANFAQSVWGIMGGICNSGGTAESTSFVKAWVVNKGQCCARVKAECTVEWDAIKFGMKGVGLWRAFGKVLDYDLTRSDTQHYDLGDAPYGLTTMTSWDTMKITKSRVFNVPAMKREQLYHVYGSVVMQIGSQYRGGGFSEGSRGSCSVSYVGPCSATK